MDIDKIINKTDKVTSNKNRESRDFALDPPNKEKGMSDEDLEAFFNDTSSIGDVGSTDFNTYTGENNGQSSPYSPFNQNMNNTQNNQNYSTVQPKEEIDYFGIFLKIASAFLKGTWKFLTQFFDGLKGKNTRYWTKSGATITIVGFVMVVSALFSLLFSKALFFDLMIAGVLNIATGLSFVLLLYDRAKKEDEEIILDDDETKPVYNSNSTTNEYTDDEEDEEWNPDEDYDDEEDYTPSEEIDNEIVFDDSLIFNNQYNSQNNKSIEEIINNISVPEGGLITRQFIYENIIGCLESINPNYDKMEEIDTESDFFNTLNSIVVTAAKVQCNAKEDLPYLISASQNITFIKLDISRVKTLKNLTSFCEEIANIFKVDEEKGVIPEQNEGIFANYLTVGNKIIVKVFKGEAALISIKDIILKNKEFFLNPSNVLPCIIGVDGDGQAILRDFKNIESMLITGLPRSGKTWFTLNIVYQLCLWNSPDDIHLYICDPKKHLSDFKNYTLPHVKKFVTDDSSIVSTLRELVKVESEKRSELIGKGTNKVNIWDYKKENPDIKLPVIYVIIDEVVSLADRMDRDTKSEFQGYLRELVTRLPAAGIRAIFIPHEIKNDIINKTTTNAIAFRASVKGTPAHIEQNVGVKNFPFLLSKVGDIAIRLPDTEPKFVHGSVLTSTNDGNEKLFNITRKMWIKINEKYGIDNIAEEAEKNEAINNLIKSELEDINNF